MVVGIDIDLIDHTWQHVAELRLCLGPGEGSSWLSYANILPRLVNYYTIMHHYWRIIAPLCTNYCTIVHVLFRNEVLFANYWHWLMVIIIWLYLLFGEIYGTLYRRC